MVATYIDFSSYEEQLLALAALLDKVESREEEEGKEGKEGTTPSSSNKLVTECGSLLEGKKVRESVEIVLKHSAALFTSTSEKEIEAFFLALTSLIRKLAPEERTSILTQFLPILTTTTSTSSPLGSTTPTLRLKLLTNTYNILDGSPRVRHQIFMHILQFAEANQLSQLLLPQFKNIEKRIAEWELEREQIKELYKKAASLHRIANQNLESYSWTVKYLGLLDASSSEAREEGVKAIVEAIKIPNLFQMDDLLNIPLVQQLEKDSKHGKLYQLLSIFVNESLEAFQSFVKANEDYLKSLGLEKEECVKKMRYLSLATLAAAHTEIPYAVISKALQIDSTEVELWVIGAIGESLVDAKLDQLREVVLVTRSLQRVFNRAQWKQLSDNLIQWKTNVDTLLLTVQQARAQNSIPSFQSTR